jgi:serine protease Do
VLVEPLNETLQQRWDVNGGIIIKEVAAESAAEAAGLRPGDVVTMLDGVHIDSVETFSKVQKALPVNKLVPMRIIRAGKPMFVPLRVQ